jgi:hypothetical protein
LAKDLFKREPLYFLKIHPVFGYFEKHLLESGMQTKERLDMATFKTCAGRLDVNDPTHAREVFGAFKDFLPTRITNQPETCHELDDIPFIPRRMDTEWKLPNLDRNEPGWKFLPK